MVFGSLIPYIAIVDDLYCVAEERKNGTCHSVVLIFVFALVLLLLLLLLLLILL